MHLPIVRDKPAIDGSLHTTGASPGRERGPASLVVWILTGEGAIVGWGGDFRHVFRRGARWLPSKPANARRSRRALKREA